MVLTRSVALKWVTHRLTDVGSQAALTPTRTKSSTHKYRIETCCRKQCSLLLKQQVLFFFFFLNGRTDRRSSTT